MSLAENVGMDTPHAVDVYIVFAVTTGIRALEPWLATRAPGRATGSAYNHTVTMVTCVAIGSRCMLENKHCNHFVLRSV